MIRLVGMAYIALLAGLVFGLYHISYQTDESAEELRDLEQRIEREKVEIQTLQSEWSVRTSPDYLAKLTAKFLPEMGPTTPGQMVALSAVAPRTEELPASPTIEDLLALAELNVERVVAQRKPPRRPPSL